MAIASMPDLRPSHPNFSSGPCAKRPGFKLDALSGAYLGRSHRATEPKARIAEVIVLSRSILGLPDNWRLGIVPGSDTGAFEMALWSMLGARAIDIITYESFGEGWATDIVSHLKLPDARLLSAPYGKLPDLTSVNPSHDIVFAWNGTTSGVRVPNADWIAADRQGLGDLRRHIRGIRYGSLPWQKLDVVTWSWQKVLGGERPRTACSRCHRAQWKGSNPTPLPWPLPKIFRLTAKGKINEGIFKGETINTPSMLCVEDAHRRIALGQNASAALPALIARSEANLAAVGAWVRQSFNWAGFLARGRKDPLLHLDLPEDRRASWFTALPPYSGRPRPPKQLAGLLEKQARRLRHRRLSRRPAWPAHLGWCDHRDQPTSHALLPWLDWAAAQVAASYRTCLSNEQDSAMPKVLISDKLSPAAVAIFRRPRHRR